MRTQTEEFSRDTKFLVTGGGGFIGSNLCESILSQGYKVRCLDNLSTGLRKNVELFADNENYEFIEGDIRDYKTCLTACFGVDYVLHQAAWGSVPRSLKFPLPYIENNVLGTANMLEAARQSEVKKFVYASSSTVYGRSPVLVRKEGEEGESLSPYAATKLMCEQYARQYSLNFGLDTYGLRYFNVFGRRQNPNGEYAAVIPKFIKSLIKGEVATIYGDGCQLRDFTYVDNIVEANLKACQATSEIAGNVFNVGCGQIRTLIEIYEIISDLLGKNIIPQFATARAGDIRHSTADISKARNLLGYSPKYDFEQGIKATIDWYKSNREAWD